MLSLTQHLGHPISKIWLISLTCFVVACMAAPSALAETMESDNFTIRMGNFNMTSGYKSSATYSLTDTVGQTAANFFSSTGYHVKAGFQYIYTLYDFSFSVSSLLVDFGTLTPNTFATGNHNLVVSSPGQGYSVTTYASNPMTNRNGDTIPSTTCDSGPCTTTTAEVWTNTSNVGFGYNLTGDDVAADFAGSNYFRPFPDFSLGDTPATVMSTTQAGRDRTALVTYKVNISGSQAAGTYNTNVVYIATPTY